MFQLAPGRFAHASGGLWLAASRALLLADVHLGFGWALRRRGQLGPVDDGPVRAKLRAVSDELRPEAVVFLGDVVHAPRPVAPERDSVVAALRSLAGRLVVVLGNHDRAFAQDYPGLGIEVCALWRGDGVVAVHGDKGLPLESGEHVVAGHLHPALGITDNAGATRKMPAFVAGTRVTLLPAFSPLAAGFDVRAGLPDTWFRGCDPRIVVASGRRTVDVGPLSRLRAL